MEPFDVRTEHGTEAQADEGKPLPSSETPPSSPLLPLPLLPPSLPLSSLLPLPPPSSYSLSVHGGASLASLTGGGAVTHIKPHLFINNRTTQQTCAPPVATPITTPITTPFAQPPVCSGGGSPPVGPQGEDLQSVLQRGPHANVHPQPCELREGIAVCTVFGPNGPR